MNGERPPPIEAGCVHYIVSVSSEILVCVWYYIYGVHGFINHERKKAATYGEAAFFLLFLFFNSAINLSRIGRLHLHSFANSPLVLIRRFI